MEQCEKSGDFEERTEEVSYSVEKDYVDDLKSTMYLGRNQRRRY